MQEARGSAHSFQDAVEEDLVLVYNDPVVFSGRHLAPEVRGRGVPEVYMHAERVCLH